MRYSSVLLAALFGSATLMVPLAASAQAAPAAPAGQIQFRLIQYNTPGSDLPVTNAKLNQEFVTLKAGAKVVIHTGRGTSNSGNRYWGRGYYVWNNTGDKAKLHTAAGRWKDSCSWGDGPGSLYC